MFVSDNIIPPGSLTDHIPGRPVIRWIHGETVCLVRAVAAV